MTLMREKGQELSAKALPGKDTVLLAGRVRRSRAELAREHWFERYQIKHECIRLENCQISTSIFESSQI